MKNILVDAVYCFIIQNDTKFEVFQDMFKLLETYPNNKIILTGANELVNPQHAQVHTSF